jgi:putative flippase GtrA
MEIVAIVLGVSSVAAALALAARRCWLRGPAVPRNEDRSSVFCQLLAGAGGLLSVNAFVVACATLQDAPFTAAERLALVIAPGPLTSVFAAFAASAVWLFSESWYGRSRRSVAALVASIGATQMVVLVACLNVRWFDAVALMQGIIAYQAAIILAAVLGYRISHGRRLGLAVVTRD